MVHTMLSNEEKIYELLKGIEDPELPISIVDLGIVQKVWVDDQAVVELVPTFSGCPALEYMERQVQDVLEHGLDGMRVVVKWDMVGHWDVDRISSQGKEKLREYGISIPVGNTVYCPYCDSEHIVKDSPFGPSLCRELYYCKHCKNPFEKMRTLKKVSK